MSSVEVSYSREQYSPNPIELSIVIPVFNQEEIIAQNLDSVFRSISLISELIIINDASTDNTLKNTLNFLNNINLNKYSIKKIVVLSSGTSLFETKCDQIGFEMSKSPYVLEIQADMKILEFGFDKKMLQALKKFDDLLMVSGRGTEPLNPIISSYSRTLGTDRSNTPSLLKYLFQRTAVQIFHYIRELNFLVFFKSWRKINFSSSNKLKTNIQKNSSELFNEIFPDPEKFTKANVAGLVGELFDFELTENQIPKNRIWVGQTVMRGPLLIDNNKLKKLNGLDTERFFQGYDDHDLVIRAFLLYNFRVGYVPVVFSSPIHLGTTRKQRSIKTELIIIRKILNIYKKRKTSKLWLASKDNLSNLPKSEVWYF